MNNKLISGLLALASMPVTGFLLYKLQCESMGGALQGSTCFHTFYKELFYSPSLPFYLLIFYLAIVTFCLCSLFIARFRKP